MESTCNVLESYRRTRSQTPHSWGCRIADVNVPKPNGFGTWNMRQF
jgi:hypothetical protein